MIVVMVSGAETHPAVLCIPAVYLLRVHTVVKIIKYNV